MGFFLVMKAEMVRTWIITRRYWFRTLVGLVVGYGMLLALVLGFMNSRAEVSALTQRLADSTNAINMVLGFIIGMFAFGVVGMFTQGLSEMAQSGQLEQLCMSPHGLVTNFLARSAVGSVSNILSSAVMVWLIARSIGGTLHADFMTTAVLLALTFFNLIGFGFMVGGLVLVFKQTGQIAVLIRMAMLGLAMFATDKIDAGSGQWPVVARWMAHALPITDASICMKYVLVQGQMRPTVDSLGSTVLDAAGAPVMAFSSVYAHSSFFLLLVSCVVWTVLGIACFRMMENHSRNKGTLGAY